MTESPAIDVVDVDKSFGKQRAVVSATLAVPKGAIVALLGPSGSGKTTLLRIIAGFEHPDAGIVTIGGHIVAGDGTWTEPEHRRIGMVFQDGALFPHLTVAGNVGFGDASAARVEECLELVGLADRARSYPHELSGGERQRVALARALAPEPDVVLLDEPFASLDAALRLTLREDVVAILRRAGASALLVTHDQQEALSLADRVVVMRDGHVVQSGPPDEVYASPRSRWIAEFLGDAEILSGTATDGTVDCELGRLPTLDTARGAVEVVVRPEALAIAAGDASAAGDGVPARVVGRSFFGHDQIVVLELDSGRILRSRSSGMESWHVGDDVRLRVEGVVTTLAPGHSAEG